MEVKEKNLVEFLSSNNEDNKENKYFDLCLQIDNILSSYDDEFDAFSELVQNSMDAVAYKYETHSDYKPEIVVTVNCEKNTLSVLDNGCGVEGSDFSIAMRPNASLKRRLNHKNTRGEKGAALVFLQFGHHGFEFHSKTVQSEKSYKVADGRQWFIKTLDVLEDQSLSFDQKQFPNETFVLSNTITQQLSTYETGTFVEVTFGDGCQLKKLESIFDGDKPLRKLEYILRTRTAIGYYYQRNKDAFQQDLTIKIKIIKNNGEKLSENPLKIETGFLFPNELAQKKGSIISKMTDLKKNSELIYEFITNDFIDNHFSEFLNSNKEFKHLISKYSVNGYFSYAYKNDFYEKISSEYMGINNTQNNTMQLIQINGGLKIFVKEFPNGRIHSFLHRSGAEHKSRTFVLLNFGGKYKPDYGRKNISDEVRKFVLKFCQELINFATRKERRTHLINGPGKGRESVRTQKDAEQLLLEETKKLKEKCEVWVKSNEEPITTKYKPFLREPVYEDEVILEFIWLLQNGFLSGYKIYGLPSVYQLDALFDYHLVKEDKYIYHPENNPNGLNFPIDRRELSYENQWIEFKISSDRLIDDFNKESGESGKKYFGLIHLLICFEVDDSTDNYEIEMVDDHNKQDQAFYGVTHYLKSIDDQTHVIQVIELKTLRKLLKYIK
jgi:hypothetical protein